MVVNPMRLMIVRMGVSRYRRASGSAKTAALGALVRRLSMRSTAVLPSRFSTTVLRVFQMWMVAKLPARIFLATSVEMTLPHSGHAVPLVLTASALLKTVVRMAGVFAPLRSLSILSPLSLSLRKRIPQACSDTMAAVAIATWSSGGIASMLARKAW